MGKNELIIPEMFINHASDTLAYTKDNKNPKDTKDGLTGSLIAKLLTGYAIKFDVVIPFSTYPFPKSVPNKRTALKENLRAFSPEQQFIIIKELCEHDKVSGNSEVVDLKAKLLSRYSHLAKNIELQEVNEDDIQETIHWLQDYPDPLKLYGEAIEKYRNKIYTRNLLDDLRLSLELLLKAILKNNKSLENQFESLGKHLKSRNGSLEINSMFVKLIDYYSKYQNRCVKHNDSVNDKEVMIILEMTTSFMKFLIRLK